MFQEQLCSSSEGQNCIKQHLVSSHSVAGIPRNFVQGRGSNSVEDRERGSGSGSPLVRGSGDSCNLVQEISFHIVYLNLRGMRKRGNGEDCITRS